MTLTWLPSLVAGPMVTLSAAAASHGVDWATVVALGGMVATLVSAATGLIVALRRKDTPVVIISPEQAAEMGILDPEPKPRRRRRSKP